MKISYLKLWKLLLDKRLKKTDLLKLADISTTTLAKLSKDQSVGMDVMARICTALSCDISDIAEMVPVVVEAEKLECNEEVKVAEIRAESENP